MKNHYGILCLSPRCTMDDIRTAYRRLALEHHPDRGGDAEKMKEINASYEHLLANHRTDAERLARPRFKPCMEGFEIIVGGFGRHWEFNSTGARSDGGTASWTGGF